MAEASLTFLPECFRPVGVALNETAVGGEGNGFNSRAGQIVHSHQWLSTVATFLRSRIACALRREYGPCHWSHVMA